MHYSVCIIRRWHLMLLILFIFFPSKCQSRPQYSALVVCLEISSVSCSFSGAFEKQNIEKYRKKPNTWGNDHSPFVFFVFIFLIKNRKYPRVSTVCGHKHYRGNNDKINK
jgi:hypothetical protein